MSGFIFYAAGGVLLMTLLAFNVSRLRMRERISLGDGGNAQLQSAIRAHGNAVEQIPAYGLLVLAFNYTGISETLVFLFAILFLVARVAHAYGMLFRQFQLRRLGAGLSYLLALLSSIVLLGWVVF